MMGSTAPATEMDHLNFDEADSSGPVPVDHPGLHAPIHPSDRAPIHPSDRAPIHPSDRAPIHPSDRAPIHPSDRAPVHPAAPRHPHTVRFDSPSLTTSTLTRRLGGVGAGAAATAAGAGKDYGEGRGHCSELDLPSFERLPVRPDLHRPDSVITTSSIVSSETASVVEGGVEAVAAPPAPPSVYTISGLYGADKAGKDEKKTHKRSTSNTATSMMRSCQNTHKRSHSHSVGYGHKRSGSTGFHAGHRRTASGAIVDTLNDLTGSGPEHQMTTTEFLQSLQKQHQEHRAAKLAKEEEAEDNEYADLNDCGYLACRPACGKPLASVKVFVLLLAMLVVLQQALSSGYLNSVITTIEKRYEIPSSISGIVASMYEIGNVGTVIFVSYLGSRRHIPVWIGTGCFIMGIGSIIFSLPHFWSESYTSTSPAGLNVTDENMCRIPQYREPSSTLNQLVNLGDLDNLLDDNDNVEGPHNNQFNRDDNCIKEASKSAALPIFIFMIAQLLLGCGGSPLFTLGTTYIDDHVKRDEASMYIGCVYSMVAFGPVLGFLLGAYLLSHYVDEFSHDMDQLNIDSSDRHWIGMWWGGFLIIGVLMILISIPFFAFPKELKREKRKVYLDEKYAEKNAKPKPKGDKVETQKNAKPKPKGDKVETEKYAEKNAKPKPKGDKVETPDTAKDGAYGKDLKDLPKSIWKLITNWVFLVTCLGACMELIIVSGFIVFLPKYLETQFALSKSEASMMTGGIAIPGACIGIFLGGYILKRLSLGPKGAVQLVLFFNFLCLGCYGMLFFLGCNNVKMAGTTMPYYNSSQSASSGPFRVNLTASCNFGCSCDMNDVQPVCGGDGITYFSPCHAGCTSIDLGSQHNYTNCACVINGQEEVNMSRGTGVRMVPVATAGPCYTQCQMILPFMVLLFFMTLLVAVTQMPVLMVVLRSVKEEEKSFALGIQFVIFRLFGYIPSPIIFGNVIDSTCILWKQTCEGEMGGRCLLYDIESFRYKYVGICAGIKVLSVLIFSFLWWLIRRRANQEKLEAGLTVGDLVNSIVSLNKLSEGDSPTWIQLVDGDAEEAGGTNSMMATNPNSCNIPLSGESSAESTPAHHGVLSPTRQPMIPHKEPIAKRNSRQ